MRMSTVTVTVPVAVASDSGHSSIALKTGHRIISQSLLYVPSLYMLEGALKTGTASFSPCFISPFSFLAQKGYSEGDTQPNAPENW